MRLILNVLWLVLAGFWLFLGKRGTLSGCWWCLLANAG